MFWAAQFTGLEGNVREDRRYRGASFKKSWKASNDDVPEQAFYLVGRTIDERLASREDEASAYHENAS